ncbi:hypothetical protein ACRE_007900 [Hapsidospora chrysogenum ATCC 11550]|uniref:Uncharacterized protein n=1 Tax=Hapsidospora chrysogenum (strain ATCC 11550 / CBS 779.69 / DSM 880 / IAM 14645 / JCM 23072 / IMI 49137) TaxID=857340 RepID=A0A086TFV2_HAPC1|nr:hypothetical protein ACRE_007900 [Hapsidospora chrysogenum ATCC 11550]
MAYHWVHGDPEVARDPTPPPLRRLRQPHCELAHWPVASSYWMRGEARSKLDNGGAGGRWDGWVHRLQIGPALAGSVHHVPTGP